MVNLKHLSLFIINSLGFRLFFIAHLNMFAYWYLLHFSSGWWCQIFTCYQLPSVRLAHSVRRRTHFTLCFKHVSLPSCWSRASGRAKKKKTCVNITMELPVAILTCNWGRKSNHKLARQPLLPLQHLLWWHCSVCLRPSLTRFHRLAPLRVKRGG